MKALNRTHLRTVPESNVQLDPAPVSENLAPLAYSRAEAACVSRIPRTTIDRAIANAELSVIRYGGGSQRARDVILREDLVAWLKRMRKPASWEVER